MKIKVFGDPFFNSKEFLDGTRNFKCGPDKTLGWSLGFIYPFTRDKLVLITPQNRRTTKEIVASV